MERKPVYFILIVRCSLSLPIIFVRLLQRSVSRAEPYHAVLIFSGIINVGIECERCYRYPDASLIHDNNRGLPDRLFSSHLKVLALICNISYRSYFRSAQHWLFKHRPKFRCIIQPFTPGQLFGIPKCLPCINMGNIWLFYLDPLKGRSQWQKWFRIYSA